MDMIFYFSGTGNSQRTAMQLSEILLADAKGRGAMDS